MKNQFILGIFVMLAGCQTKNVSIDELRKFLTNSSNGLHKTSQISGVTTRLSFVPTDLLVYDQLTLIKYDRDKLDSVSNQYFGQLYFHVGFSVNGREALHPSLNANYTELVENLSFRMTQYASARTSLGRKVDLLDAVLDRTYGMAGSSNVLLVFNKADLINEDWIDIELKELGFGIGNQRFRFSMNDIKNTPIVTL